MSINLLQAVYYEATSNNGLINLTKELRADGAKYDQDADKIAAIFDGLPLWEKQKTASGHACYKHLLSGKVVGWQAHGDKRINPKITSICFVMKSLITSTRIGKRNQITGRLPEDFIFDLLDKAG